MASDRDRSTSQQCSEPFSPWASTSADRSRTLARVASSSRGILKGVPDTRWPAELAQGLRRRLELDHQGELPLSSRACQLVSYASWCSPKMSASQLRPSARPRGEGDVTDGPGGWHTLTPPEEPASADTSDFEQLDLAPRPPSMRRQDTLRAQMQAIRDALDGPAVAPAASTSSSRVR
jgi:hypothetical protein